MTEARKENAKIRYLMSECMSATLRRKGCYMISGRTRVASIFVSQGSVNTRRFYWSGREC